LDLLYIVGARFFVYTIEAATGVKPAIYPMNLAGATWIVNTMARQTFVSEGQR